MIKEMDLVKKYGLIKLPLLVFIIMIKSMVKVYYRHNLGFMKVNFNSIRYLVKVNMIGMMDGNIKVLG